MDQEKLKKYHFWLLLIPFTIFCIVSWLAVVFGVSEATADQIAAIEKHEKELKNAVTSAKSQTLSVKLNAQKDELISRRTSMWKIAWDAQKDIFFWPKAFGQRLADLQKRPFGAPIPEREILSQIRNNDYYLKEYLDLVEGVVPMKFKDGWTNVLSYVKDWETRLNPESEEVWLALEDLWVQTQLVLIADRVNHKAAQFVMVDPENAKKSPLHRKFRSRNWEIDLQVGTNEKKQNVLQAKLKNITDHLQIMGVGNQMYLKVWLAANEDPIEFVIEGDNVKAGEEIAVKPLKKHILSRSPEEILQVEQMFDERTVPIKRIDKISLGYLSSRTSIYQLKMAPFSQKVVDEIAKQNAATTPTTTPTTGGPGPMGGMPTSGGTPPVATGSTGGASATDTDTTPLGLKRKRYLDTTEQVRRLPFGMVLIADESYFTDILEATANSPLRIQLTQFHWSRSHDAMSYSTSNRATLTSGMNLRSGFPGMGYPGMGFPGGKVPPMIRPGGGSRGPMNPMGGIPGANPPSDEPGIRENIADNLLEISLYGIANLYQMFPEGLKVTEPKTTQIGAPKTQSPSGVTPPGNLANPPTNPPTNPPGKIDPKSNIPSKSGTSVDPKEPGKTPQQKAPDSPMVPKNSAGEIPKLENDKKGSNPLPGNKGPANPKSEGNPSKTPVVPGK